MSDDGALDGADDSGEVYVTKYALTDGICKCRAPDLGKVWALVDYPTKVPGIAIREMVRRSDIHHNLKAAQKRARQLARRRLKSLEKERLAVEVIARDGAKVVEAK